jgi:hypothetical protein
MAQSTKRKTQQSAVSDEDNPKSRLTSLGGSNSYDFNNVVVNQAVDTLWLDQSDPKKIERQRKAVVAAMIGTRPRDEIEGMLAAQMVGTHNAAMECLRRAMIENQTVEGQRESLNQANKLVRSYAMLVEALDRHRGKGQQRITVEHVHVNDGGQAIVGAVSGGRELPNEGEGEPASAEVITYKPETPMRRANPQRQALPIAAGSGKDPL